MGSQLSVCNSADPGSSELAPALKLEIGFSQN